MLQTPTAETCFQRALAYELTAYKAEQPEQVYFRSNDDDQFYPGVPTLRLPGPYAKFAGFYRAEAEFWLKQAVLLS